MPNWLTDPSLRKERVAKPLRPAINLLLKHTADLLHSNDLVGEERRNKRGGIVANVWVCFISKAAKWMAVSNANACGPLHSPGL